MNSEANSPEGQVVLADSDVQAIRELQRRWMEKEMAGHAVAVLDLCTDDVVWLPPNGPALRGKEAILAWLKEPSARPETIRLSNVQIDGNGSLAFKVADSRTRYVPSGSSEAVMSAGSHVWVLRRELDATWRVVLVAWTSDHSPRVA